MRKLWRLLLLFRRREVLCIEGNNNHEVVNSDEVRLHRCCSFWGCHSVVFHELQSLLVIGYSK